MTSQQPAAHQLERSFRSHHRLLWGLCYRMTGSSADADDLLQDTFTRALSHPPSQGGELRGWLVRVAMNLARDLLRKRKRRGYRGTWLPTPVALADGGWAGADVSGPAPAPEQPRYELLESASLAFLVSLEALTTRQRAVLLLRDVLDFSVRETASALEVSEANVKTTLHRARAAMTAYDAQRPSMLQKDERVRRTLESFMAALIAQDADAVAALLAADVRALSDGGGEYSAARVPVLGRDKVGLFYRKIAAQRTQLVQAALHHINGRPTLVARFDSPDPRHSPWVITTLDVNKAGEIINLYTILATPKVSPLLASLGLQN